MFSSPTSVVSGQCSRSNKLCLIQSPPSPCSVPCFLSWSDLHNKFAKNKLSTLTHSLKCKWLLPFHFTTDLYVLPLCLVTGSSIFFNMTSVPLCLRFVFQRNLNPIISFCFWLISSQSLTVELQKECYAGVQSWPKDMLQVQLNTPLPIPQCKNSLLKRCSIDTSFDKVLATYKDWVKANIQINVK